MITHLSYPTSIDINDFIDPELCTVQYTSFDSVVDMISTLRKWVNLEKMDISFNSCFPRRFRFARFLGSRFVLFRQLND